MSRQDGTKSRIFKTKTWGGKFYPEKRKIKGKLQRMAYGTLGEINSKRGSGREKLITIKEKRKMSRERFPQQVGLGAYSGWRST